MTKNGRVVTAVDDSRADIFVNGETVALIGRDLAASADRVIDASGRLVIPGGVDPHTHMEMPFGGTESSDTFETGYPRGRIRRHDAHRGFRNPEPRRVYARGAGHLARQGGRQGSHLARAEGARAR